MPLWSARRIIALLLIATFIPAQGLAWPTPRFDWRNAAGPSDAISLQVFLRALNSTEQQVMTGANRPQIYLVYRVNAAVPASMPLLVAAPIGAWFDDFLKALQAMPAPAPAESILDEIEAGNAQLNSTPGVTALRGMPDSLPFKPDGPLDAEGMNKAEVALSNALQQVGLNKVTANRTTETDTKRGTITYTERGADGDVVVTAQVTADGLQLRKEFLPLLGSGELGDPLRVRSGNTGTPTQTSNAPVQTTGTPTQSTNAGTNAAAATGLPPGARPIPNEVVRQWGSAIYDYFAGQTATITGQRDSQGRLLDMNGQVISRNVLVTLRATQAMVVKDLRGFAADVKTKIEGTREDKIALAKDLQTKATAVQAAHGVMVTTVEEYGKWSNTNYVQLKKSSLSAAEKADAEWRAKVDQAKANYVQLLNADPLLGVEHNGVKLWEGLTNPGFQRSLQTSARGLAVAADQPFVELINPYLKQAMTDASGQATEISLINDLERLAEFSTPVYAGVHERFVIMGNTIGSDVPRDLIAELQAASTGSLKGWWDEAMDRVITKGLIVISIGSIFIPGIGPFLALAASGAQVIRSGNKVYIAYGKAEDATGRASVTGYDQVMKTSADLSMAGGELFFDIGFGALDVLAALKAGEAIQLARAERAEQAVADALAGAIPRGAAATTRPVTDAAGILNRIDGATLAGKGRAGTPGDAAFFREAGLAPQTTVEVGGQTFHLSKPFKGPGGRTGVVAFQETADGKIILRTFYLSGEHGVWRAASAFSPGLQKGPVRYYTSDPRVPNSKAVELTAEQAQQLGKPFVLHVNESSVDLAAELQGPLHRWAGEQGVIELDLGDGMRAFLAHLEDAGDPTRVTEFGAFVKAEDVVEPFGLSRPGDAPDFTKGPLDRWTFQHPYYGDAEGFLYQSVDGDSLFIVVRDKDGRVFVPSVQDGGAGITPFGTRTTAIKTDLTETPVQHVTPGKNQKGEFLNEEYIDVGQGHRNALNEAFEKNLPPRGGTANAAPSPNAAGVTRAQDNTPTVIDPGRQPGTATFAPGGRAAGGLGGDNILHVHTLVDARHLREGNTAAIRQWTGQELERLRTLRNDPAQFRSEYGGKLSQRDIEAIDGILKHFKIDPATGQRAASGITVPPPPARLPNNTIGMNTAGTADEIADGVINSQQKGATAPQLAKDAQAALARAGLKPQQLADALKTRLLSPPAPRPVSMADLGNPAALQPPGLQVAFTALGVSSGVAFNVNAVNNGTMPIELQGEGVVVEPVRGGPSISSAGTSRAIATPQLITEPVEAFCLERVRPVAPPGTQYRVAPPAVQMQHRRLVDILHAAKRVMDVSGLHPDSDPKTYFNFIRQWSIWSRQENFDEKQFSEEFMNQTKKNVESQGVKWTNAMQDTVRKAAPGRWRDILSVLSEATKLAPRG